MKIKNLKLKIYPKGFTLIELIVVITIIAVLVGAVSVSFRKAQEKSRDARRKSDLKAVQQALEVYYDTTGQYPASIINFPQYKGKIICFTPYNNTPLIAWGSAFKCTNTSDSSVDVFMNQLPKDPIKQISSGDTEGYYYENLDGTNLQDYVLAAKLENANDPDIDPNCAPDNRNYCLSPE